MEELIENLSEKLNDFDYKIVYTTKIESFYVLIKDHTWMEYT